MVGRTCVETLARRHPPRGIAERRIGSIRPGLRLTACEGRAREPEDLAARDFGATMFTWQCH